MTLAFDAFELVTAIVVGFVIEEQQRGQSIDPSRYSPEERDARLGPEVSLDAQAGHARHDNAVRFDHQLQTVFAGLRGASEMGAETNAYTDAGS